MASNKYGSSAVTWSLSTRVLLTCPALIPLLLLFGGVMVITVAATDNTAAAATGAMFMVMGLASAAIVPIYLMSVWRPRPGWHKEQKAEQLRVAQLNEALAKQLAPPTTNDSEPTHTRITRRH